MRTNEESLGNHRKRLPRLLRLAGIIVLLILYVLNVSKPGKAVEGCPIECARNTDRKPGAMRVLSLNMLHGFPLFENLSLRIDLIAAEIRRLDADVVLMQEVPWTIRTGNVAKLLGSKLGFNYLYYRANGNKQLIFFEEGEAILSRYPLRDEVTAKLQPSVGVFQHRVALGATVDTPWGGVKMYSIHLTHSDTEINVIHMQALRGFVEAHTRGIAIVGGDFNAKDESAQIKSLDHIWLDTYREAHPGDIGYTCCTDDLHAPPGVPMQMRIDYIFLVNSNWKLVNAEHAFNGPFKVDGGWQWASDHTGLMVEIEP